MVCDFRNLNKKTERYCYKSHLTRFILQKKLIRFNNIKFKVILLLSNAMK